MDTVRLPLIGRYGQRRSWLVALPGVLLFWFMIRSGLADVSMGTALREEPPAGRS